MSGAQQAVFQNQRSFIPPVPVVGSALGGGFFAGQISTAGNGTADFNLVIGPKSTAQSGSAVQWKTSSTSTPGTSSLIDGPANSAAMNDASHPAAQFCEGLTIGGFSDWYMPARNELEVCYYNLKPTTTSNNTSYGANTNAVPSRASNYTAGTPAQTSAAVFQSGGAQAFSVPGPANQNYWSSSEATGISPNYAWFIRFNPGGQYFDGKANSYLVRAVRRVAV